MPRCREVIPAKVDDAAADTVVPRQAADDETMIQLWLNNFRIHQYETLLVRRAVHIIKSGCPKLRHLRSSVFG